MDPVACLADYLEATTNDQRFNAVCDWRLWLNRGGYRPLACNIKGACIKRGMRWTRRHHLLVILAGAI